MTPEEKALEVFLKNDAWREYYEKAPSDACRKAIAGEFVRSMVSPYSAEYNREKLEAPLTLEDWEWLYRWCGSNPRKGFIARKIEKLRES